MSLRVAGGGHAGEPGAPPGDLYVTVKVKEDPELLRDGDGSHAPHEGQLR